MFGQHFIDKPLERHVTCHFQNIVPRIAGVIYTYLGQRTYRSYFERSRYFAFAPATIP